MRSEQIRTLIDRCTLPDRCGDAELIETHISWIILTDNYAFKVKKPVRFSFLDFSTLQLRSQFCRKELELNRRLAPQMYLQVIPLTAGMAGTSNGEDPDTIVDFAVQMKKMDRRKAMNHLLEQKRVGTSDLDRIAGKVAAFHRRARIIKNVFHTTGFLEKYSDILTVKKEIGEMLGGEWTARTEECVERAGFFLNASRNLFNQRIITNFRRDCHGDLNSTNIFLYEDPVIFDCIEFNKEFRHIDVINEVAFLCVDLDFYDNPGLSDHFYHSYLDAYGMEEDENLRNLWNFYKSYRANVQAKVSALNTRENGGDHPVHTVQKYLRLMERYMGELQA